jgi:lipopolysaccharide/colanic/teichoic acid biosynthesis glycosyltransferase
MTRWARPLLYLGVLGVVFGLARVHAAWIGHYPFTGSSRFAWTVVYAVVLCVTAYGFGLPDVPRTKKAMLSSSVGAAFVGALVMSVAQLLVGDALLPRFVVFGSAIILPDWYRLCVRLSAGGRAYAEARDRVAVVAAPDEITALETELEALPERPASVVAGVTPEEATATPASPEPLRACLAEVEPTVVVLDRAAQDDPTIVAQVADLHERGVRVRTLTGFYEGWLGKLPMSELERTSLFFDIGELHRARYGRAKRLVDVPLALAGVVVLAVVIPIVWLGNLAGNRGSLLYRQLRVGKAGQEFTILKFRTMRTVDSDSTAWTTADDPRVTPFGRFLRRSHLDELPQVVNILRGDLSVVGPRPEQPHYVRELEAKLPFYRLRHLVRPGLTGWAQVNYGYAGDERDALEKLQYDFWYLRHQSLSLDVRIIGRTIRSTLGGPGGGR